METSVVGKIPAIQTLRRLRRQPGGSVASKAAKTIGVADCSGYPSRGVETFFDGVKSGPDDPTTFEEPQD